MPCQRISIYSLWFSTQHRSTTPSRFPIPTHVILSTRSSTVTNLLHGICSDNDRTLCFHDDTYTCASVGPITLMSSVFSTMTSWIDVPTVCRPVDVCEAITVDRLISSVSARRVTRVDDANSIPNRSPSLSINSSTPISPLLPSSHPLVSDISCKVLNYSLSCSTRVSLWLTTFVALERVYTTVFLTSHWFKQPHIARRLIILTFAVILLSAAYELVVSTNRCGPSCTRSSPSHISSAH